MTDSTRVDRPQVDGSRMERPRIPLWAAVMIPAAAYTLRSLTRGSFRPDLPEDAVVLGALLGLLVLSAIAGTAAQRKRAELPDEMHDRDDSEGHRGQHDKIDTDVEPPGPRSS